MKSGPGLDPALEPVLSFVNAATALTHPSVSRMEKHNMTMTQMKSTEYHSMIITGVHIISEVKLTTDINEQPSSII